MRQRLWEHKSDEELDESGCFVDKERETELATAMRTLYNDTPAGKLVSALFDVVDADGSGFLEEEEGKSFLAASPVRSWQLGRRIAASLCAAGVLELSARLSLRERERERERADEATKRKN